MYLAVGQTYRIEHEMEPLGPGETTPPPPEPRAEAEVEPELEPDPFAEFGTEPTTSFAPVAGFGRLVVRVQPADASIFVDGEEWYSPDGSRLELEVGVGRHRIEVRREGYESYVTDVTVAQRRVEGGEHQPAEEPAGDPGGTRAGPRSVTREGPVARTPCLGHGLPRRRLWSWSRYTAHPAAGPVCGLDGRCDAVIGGVTVGRSGPGNGASGAIARRRKGTGAWLPSRHR